MLGGCLVGPKYSRPTVKAPTAYQQEATKSDSITNLKWWDVFKDTSLQSLIRVALAENKDLLTAIARVEESKAILGYNKANLGPFLDYSVRGRATDFGKAAEDANIAFPTTSTALLGNVNWEIDLWGKLRHANRAAFAQLMASEEDRKWIYVSLISQVAEGYFRLRGLDERLDLVKRTYQSRKEYLNIITLRFERGEVSELDKLQSEQLTASAEAQIFSLERDIVITENSLNVLLGRTAVPIGRGLTNLDQAVPSDIPQGIPSQLLERRPDVRSSEQKLIAQTEQIGVAVALRFPSLSLTGFFGVASPELSNLTKSQSVLGSVTGQLAGPVFRFNQNKRRVEAEKALAQQLGYQYELTVLQAFADVENSLAQIRTYRNEYTARTRQVAASQTSLNLSKALYDNGYTSFLQVLDAERQLLDSEYDKSLALQGNLISTVMLYKALGGGW